MTQKHVGESGPLSEASCHSSEGCPGPPLRGGAGFGPGPLQGGTMSASRLAAWRRPCGRFLLAPTKHTCVGFTCSLLRQEGCLLRFSAEDLPQGQLLLGGAEKESGGRVKDSAGRPWASTPRAWPWRGAVLPPPRMANRSRPGWGPGPRGHRAPTAARVGTSPNGATGRS